MFLIDRRYFRYFDWMSFALLAILSSIGLLFVFSATYKPDAPYSIFFKKQLVGIASGFFLYFIFSLVDFRSLARWGYFLYFCILGLLLFTLIKGSIGMGAQRWISLGIIKFQPSELAKLFLPAFIAYYFHTQESEKTSLQDCLPVFGILGLSFVLILKQPDLGTALIISFSGLLLIWLAGLDKKYFIVGFCCLLFSAPISWHYLKPYQKQRILVFLGHGNNQKERYQIEQSKIAIGSGGLVGKGFKKGTQNRLMFLPESRTDFIFAVICEEWGFLGGMTILLLFLMLFMRIMHIIFSLHDPYHQLLGIGLLIHLIYSTMINIGMVTGLLPIVGIPLPFISYGITHLWIAFASMGWLNSIAIRRFYTGVAEKRFRMN
jgi:rod shape determining protein RodA